MMWLLPAALAAVALLSILVAVRRMVAEASGLRRELRDFSELRPALVELRTDAAQLRTAAAARTAAIARSRPV